MEVQTNQNSDQIIQLLISNTENGERKTKITIIADGKKIKGKITTLEDHIRRTIGKLEEQSIIKIYKQLEEEVKKQKEERENKEYNYIHIRRKNKNWRIKISSISSYRI